MHLWAISADLSLCVELFSRLHVCLEILTKSHVWQFPDQVCVSWVSSECYLDFALWYSSVTQNRVILQCLCWALLGIPAFYLGLFWSRLSPLAKECTNHWWPWVLGMALPATVWFSLLLSGGSTQFISWSSPFMVLSPPHSCLVVLPVRLAILPSPISWPSSLLSGGPPHSCHSFPLLSSRDHSCREPYLQVVSTTLNSVF